MQAARFFKTLLFIFGIFLSLAATVFATGQPRRYNENSTVKGTISQSFYQVNAKTDVAVKSIAVTGTLYEKGTFGTWQKISSCSNTSASSSCSASITSFLILLSIYYGMHRLLFGEKIYLKLEVNQEDVDKMRDSIFAFLKKGEISPKNLQQHLKYLIIAEVVLWLAFIVYLFISTSTVL